MNTLMLQRLTFLAVLPLCTMIVLGAARAAEPPASPDAPASVPPAPDDTQDRSDWHDRADRQHGRFDWHARHHWHDHHEYGNELVNIGHDSNLPRGQTADSVVSIFGSSTSEGEAGGAGYILRGTPAPAGGSSNTVTAFAPPPIDRY